MCHWLGRFINKNNKLHHCLEDCRGRCFFPHSILLYFNRKEILVFLTCTKIDCIYRITRLRQKLLALYVGENMHKEYYRRTLKIRITNDTSSYLCQYLTTLQMKGRWESNINVWFPFMYSQKWNCYFQNRIIMCCFSFPSLIYLWEMYIFQGSVHMNVEIKTEAAQSPEKEYVHKWDFPCSA
jgi:hypothetical protein